MADEEMLEVTNWHFIPLVKGVGGCSVYFVTG